MIFLEDYSQQITYDENWQSVSEPEIPVIATQNEEDEAESVIKKSRKAPRQLVLTFQLVVCMIIALAAFVLKGIGGEVYAAVKDWYTANLNQTAIFDGNGGFSLSNLFAATKDEA